MRFSSFRTLWGPEEQPKRWKCLERPLTSPCLEPARPFEAEMCKIIGLGCRVPSTACFGSGFRALMVSIDILNLLDDVG